MPRYVHIELELLERICDRYSSPDAAALKAYSAIAYRYNQSRGAKPSKGEPQILANLSDEVWASAIRSLEDEKLVINRNGRYEPLSCNGDEYLRLDNRGYGTADSNKKFIQISDSVFGRWKSAKAITPRTTKTRTTNDPIFQLMTPEQFFLFCLLIQGVRLFLFCGVDPSYVVLGDRPKVAEHIRRRFLLASISDDPNELLNTLLVGDTRVFEIVEIPMKKVDTLNKTLTFVPPWDSRNYDNQTGHDAKPNELVRVLLPIKGYEVSFSRDAAFLAAIHLMPDDYLGLKQTLSKYYGGASREFWNRYREKHFPHMKTDDLLEAVKPYE